MIWAIIANANFGFQHEAGVESVYIIHYLFMDV